MDLLETFARGPFQDIPLPSEVAARLVKILLNHMVLPIFFFCEIFAIIYSKIFVIFFREAQQSSDLLPSDVICAPRSKSNSLKKAATSPISG
jgi:hypothetical protein